MLKTRIDAIYAASRDGDHRYRQQGEKKKGDGHYLKCLGKTSGGNNCEARRVVTGSNEACRWQQFKPHMCTVAGVVQYVATTAVVSDFLFAPNPSPQFFPLFIFLFTHTHAHIYGIVGPARKYNILGPGSKSAKVTNSEGILYLAGKVHTTCKGGNLLPCGWEKCATWVGSL